MKTIYYQYHHHNYYYDDDKNNIHFVHKKKNAFGIECTSVTIRIKIKINYKLYLRKGEITMKNTKKDIMAMKKINKNLRNAHPDWSNQRIYAVTKAIYNK